MADTFGIKVRDETGKVTLDTSLMLHRVWHTGIYTTGGTYYYSQPLNHEPTLMAVAANASGSGRPAYATHITSNGQWTGFNLNFGSNYVASQTLVVAFATR